MARCLISLPSSAADALPRHLGTRQAGRHRSWLRTGRGPVGHAPSGRLEHPCLCRRSSSTCGRTSRRPAGRKCLRPSTRGLRGDAGRTPLDRDRRTTRETRGRSRRGIQTTRLRRRSPRERACVRRRDHAGHVGQRSRTRRAGQRVRRRTLSLNLSRPSEARTARRCPDGVRAYSYADWRAALRWDTCRRTRSRGARGARPGPESWLSR